MGLTRSRYGQSQSAGENPHLGCELIMEGCHICTDVSESCVGFAELEQNTQVFHLLFNVNTLN